MATPQTPEERAAAIWRAEMRLMERLKDLERREYSRSRKGKSAASSAGVVSIPTATARSPPEGATSSQTAACRVQDCLTMLLTMKALCEQNVLQQGRSLLQDMPHRTLHCKWPDSVGSHMTSDVMWTRQPCSMCRI